MRRWLLLGTVSVWVFSSYSADFDHTYEGYGRFLTKFVKVNGPASQVDYKAATKDRGDLDGFVKSVESVSQETFDGWTDAEKQAFLINSYNALTIKLILDNGVPKSIKKIGGWFANPWKKKFFSLFGQPSYLDQIEHERTRKNWTDCRFHFAFNCASVGCPMLDNIPFLPDKLSQQLDKAAQTFMSDRSRNRFEQKSVTFELSRIFDWYGEDFDKDPRCGSVEKFARKHLIPKSEIRGAVKIKYLDYDWSLNGVK